MVMAASADVQRLVGITAELSSRVTNLTEQLCSTMDQARVLDGGRSSMAFRDQTLAAAS
jgi:hypothetical protein